MASPLSSPLFSPLSSPLCRLPLCHFEQPAYQKKAVDKYLQKLADAGELPPESRGYNTAMRAFPDVSAQAMNYCVNAPSKEQQLEASTCTGTEFEDCKEAALNTFTCRQGGTSAAAPTLAGIIGQLNAARAKVGKGTLGFLNPLIYQHPEVFNDITQVRSLLRGHRAQAPRIALRHLCVTPPPPPRPSRLPPPPETPTPPPGLTPLSSVEPLPCDTTAHTGNSELRLCRVRRRA